MKTRYLIILFFLGICSFSFGQEILAPLSSAARPQGAKNSDTIVTELPFFDDFAEYEGLPDPKRWLTNQAYINKDYAPEAPTIGVATLDALDAYGNLYPHASSNLFSADTLASQIVRLDSLTGVYQRRLLPSDSVYLSFFYLPGGWYGAQWELVGDAPAAEDSLFLEFYDLSEQRWNTVWATAGHNADTAGTSARWPWRFVSIKIDDLRYFTRGFQFRFRNYASLDPNPKSGIAGNCDQWNIDYVYLNYNRSAADSVFRDIAFVDKAPSMLKHYQAMPARQFRQSDMASSLKMKIANRYNQTLASNYSYKVVDGNGQHIAQYDGGFENIIPFFPSGRYQEMAVHSTPPVNFAFDESTQPHTYEIIHVVREGVGGDLHNGNDTVRFQQVFGDYYAYDDGIAENGYGLTATGSKMWLAYRFDLKEQDTLTAIDLCFNRTRNGENEEVRFQLCVWSSHNGIPSSLIYKDDVKNTPQFNGRNGYHRYRLSQPVLVSDTVFIGFEQLSNDYINLGFDRSNDSRPYTFYRTGNNWMQSILNGSVMMRPAFGQSALVALPEVRRDIPLQIYPNPTGGIIRIDADATISPTATIAIYDIHGRCLLTTAFSSSLDLSPLADGLYFLRLSDKTKGVDINKKIIIKK